MRRAMRADHEEVIGATGEAWGLGLTAAWAHAMLLSELLIHSIIGQAGQQ